MLALLFQPGLKNDSDYMDFSARLAGLKILARFENTGLGFPARAELRPGLNPSPCNRQFAFQRICYRSRAEISARDEIRHVIRTYTPLRLTKIALTWYVPVHYVSPYTRYLSL